MNVEKKEPSEVTDERAIRQEIVNRYGARARAALGDAGVTDTAADACCAPGEVPSSAGPARLEFVDLSAGAAPAAADSAACCGAEDAACGVTADFETAYGSANYADTDAIPVAALAASAGCGNPIAIAELRPGERVLDLGSGGGIDCFFAAKQVGESGEVWGLDMTPDMIQLARHNAEQVDAKNVRFRLGEIEDIPFADGAFDVIISNCVINLSTDKPQVFREAFRVLASGGRLRVSDMVWTREPPVGQTAEDWAGCVAGALLVDEYLDGIRAAGFVDVDAQYAETASGLTSASVFARRP